MMMVIMRPWPWTTLFSISLQLLCCSAGWLASKKHDLRSELVFRAIDFTLLWSRSFGHYFTRNWITSCGHVFHWVWGQYCTPPSSEYLYSSSSSISYCCSHDLLGRRTISERLLKRSLRVVGRLLSPHVAKAVEIYGQEINSRLDCLWAILANGRAL